MLFRKEHLHTVNELQTNIRQIMDTIQENMEDLVDHLQDYVETQKELLLLAVKEKAASAISQTVIWVIAGVFGMLAFTFLSVALAMWLGRLLHHSGYGFLIVGALYGLGAALFYNFRKPLLQNRLNDVLLTKFTNSDD